jgi:hypothetical protein
MQLERETIGAVAQEHAAERGIDAASMCALSSVSI